MSKPARFLPVLWGGQLHGSGLLQSIQSAEELEACLLQPCSRQEQPCQREKAGDKLFRWGLVSLHAECTCHLLQCPVLTGVTFLLLLPRLHCNTGGKCSPGAVVTCALLPVLHWLPVVTSMPGGRACRCLQQQE